MIQLRIINFAKKNCLTLNQISLALNSFTSPIHLYYFNIQIQQVHKNDNWLHVFF